METLTGRMVPSWDGRVDTRYDAKKQSNTMLFCVNDRFLQLHVLYNVCTSNCVLHLNSPNTQKATRKSCFVGFLCRQSPFLGRFLLAAPTKS